MRSTDQKMKSALAALLALGLAACGPEPTPKPDAGEPTQPDAGDVTDGGTADAGDQTDAGDETDAGTDVVLTLERVTPPRGPLTGGTVLVFNGRGFVEGFAASGGREASEQTTVTFGGNTALDVNVIDDDTIEVKSPAGLAGVVDVKLTNPNGESVCAGCFRFYEPIEVTRVSPSTGSTQGGDVVTLSGQGFVADVLVLFNGTAATDVNVAPDGRSLMARTPPGVAGSADVGVVGANSSSFLRRSFLYLAQMRVSGVDPVSAPLAGDVVVTVRGEAFGADARVWFGDVEATDVQYVSATELTVTAPASGAAGAVDLTVSRQRGEAVLPRGFAYYDASRDVQLYGLVPRQGPVAGGTCADGAATCLLLSGAGFNGGNLEIKVGDKVATARIVSDHLVEIDLPPGEPGVVDLQARTDRGGAALEDAFGYVVPLVVTAVTPDVAQASGSPAVEATLSGAGFDADCQVSFGPVPGTVTGVSADGSSLSATAPPNSAGRVDLHVACGDPSTLLFREARLENAFLYEEPLRVYQVDPETGAQAGNTAVSVYGAGFVDGMTVTFGGKPATQVEVKGPHLAVLRSPRGNPGPVDVEAKVAAVQDVLPKAFTYQDPASVLGGASGGPMRGILNVTVLNSTPGMGGPVPGVTVSINDDQLTGVTDDRGQVTFSDPSLLKPVSVTGSMAGFAAATIARVDARNVTLFMQMNEGDGEPSQPPPPPGPAFFTGRVCGFKTPPGMVLQPGQRLEARVYMTARYVYAAPPFASPASPSVVLSDCGTYTIATRRYGPLALYAEFGIRDDNVQPATFTPLLMGIRRGMEAAPDRRVEGQDIILDMHRDLSIPVQVESAGPPPGKLVMNTVYSYLDLGGEGVVPLAQRESLDDEFLFEFHPRVAGEGLLFLNLASVYDPMTGGNGPPYSFFYRRQYGDPAAGVDIGPMLAFTRLSTPTAGGTFTGSLGWSYTDGRLPDVTQIFVEQPAGFASKPIWDVVLPGTELGVSLPPSALVELEPGSTLYWTVMTARSPRFEYDRFGFQQLTVTAWTSFTQDFAMFRAP